jgi:hypothetical protein
MNDGRDGWVDCVTLEIIHGSVPRREIKDALEWASGKRALLLAKFKEYNQ